MIEFTALAVVCGLGAKVFGEQADRLALRRNDPSARIAFVLDTVVGFVLLAASLLFFVLALISAPWGSL